MKAIAYFKNLPADHPEALQDITVADPVPGDHDLLVEVRAISVNPVDVKIRANRKPKDGQAEVIGWDAAGVVRAVGAKTSLFKPGDRVWYAGALNRPGANSELHVVDERIVGRMPDSLDNAAPSQGSLLVIGAAGGVGSILVQLARQLTGLTVIGTASRPETQAWVRELGAHHVIDHSQPLAAELKRIGFEHVSHIAGLTQTDQHFAQMAEAIAPQGKIALIDDPAAIDVRLLKSKSASLHWEFMFARPLHGTPDMIAQHELLNQAARLIDEGTLRTTLGAHYGKINAENLRRAHAFIESGKAQGKIVLEGF
jgi:NADPH:quinone reductase-like Zn-dependent oxidoreductase